MPVNKAVLPGLMTTAADPTPTSLPPKPAIITSSLPAAQNSLSAGVHALLGTPAVTAQAPNSTNQHLEMARNITLSMGAEMPPQICPEVSCLWWYKWPLSVTLTYSGL